MYAQWASAILWTATLIALAVGVVTDLKDRIVPNELVLLVAVCGVALTLLSRPDLIWLNILLAIVVLFGFGIFAHYRMIGWGDVKLIGAVALLVRPDRFGLVLIEIAVAGGLLSGIYLAAYHTLRQPGVFQTRSAAITRPSGAVDRFLRNERARILAADSVPYALAIFAGVGFYVAVEFHRCYVATSCLL
jgi:prepilin peptidase CpaA